MSDTHANNDEITRIDYNEIIKTVAISAIPVVGPLLAFQKSLKVLQELSDSPESKPTDIQKLKDLIKTGKEQNASKMKIEMDKSTAVGINLGDLQKEVGTNVTLGVKTENRVVLEVEYK